MGDDICNFLDAAGLRTMMDHFHTLRRPQFVQ